LPETFKDRNADVQAAQHGVDYKQEEVLVVPEADAVHDPGAMMVHFQNAALTNSTVMTSVWLVNQAVLTPAPLARKFSLMSFQVVGVLGAGQLPLQTFRHLSRTCEQSTAVADQQHRCEILRNEQLEPSLADHLFIKML